MRFVPEMNTVEISCRVTGAASYTRVTRIGK